MKKIILSFIVLVNLVYADLTKQDYKEIKKLIAMVESKSKGDLKAENSRGFLAGKNVGILAKKYLGGKYTWGGTTPSKGMDCSGYTQFIYKKIGINLPRTAYQQYNWRGGVSVKDGLKKGDLLFFNTDKKRGIPITHVGVYLEDGKFIHAASTKKGIIISSLSGYYKKVFKGAKRIIRDDKAKSVRYAKGFTQTKPLVFPKNFFKPTLENALISQTKIAMNMDPLVIYNGVYMRQSQVKKLKGN